MTSIARKSLILMVNMENIPEALEGEGIIQRVLWLSSGALLAASIASSAAAQPQFADPVSQRLVAYCKGKETCMMNQRWGIQNFLHQITLNPRPSRERVQWCLARATNRKDLTDWTKAAKCIR